VEPVAALRELAVFYHPELAGRIFAGELPDLLPETGIERYDAILLSAVIMHIPDAELPGAAAAIRARLALSGTLLISFSVGRGDVAAGAERDAAGRLMLVRPAGRIRLLFERLGFSAVGEWESADGLGRPDVSWQTLCFRYDG